MDSADDAFVDSRSRKQPKAPPTNTTPQDVRLRLAALAVARHPSLLGSAGVDLSVCHHQLR